MLTFASCQNCFFLMRHRAGFRTVADFILMLNVVCLGSLRHCEVYLSVLFLSNLLLLAYWSFYRVGRGNFLQILPCLLLGNIKALFLSRGC